MGCRCGQRRNRQTILGYEVTYPDGTKAPNLFATQLDAEIAMQKHGGGTARTIKSG